jgi:hypothetical protein
MPLHHTLDALGHVGISDVICLMGFYPSVSMTLAFYDVPAGPRAWPAELGLPGLGEN